VFTPTIENGFEMIAKITYQIAVNRYFATTSEAATLAFLRSKDIPVPEDYGYCANARNAVGTEYILVEKVPGVSLKSKWLGLTQQEAGKLAHSFVKIEETLSKLPFSSTGIVFPKRHDTLPSDFFVPEISRR
jgi:aminoglycoside phosphotransferase (APT) family kinase protein